MARPWPVLPLVGSMIVPPGFSRPARSAASIIGRPMRSFTDPPGLSISSFARMSGCRSTGPRSRVTRDKRTRGVSPTRSTIDSAYCIRARITRSAAPPSEEQPGQVAQPAGAIRRVDRRGMELGHDRPQDVGEPVTQPMGELELGTRTLGRQDVVPRRPEQLPGGRGPEDAGGHPTADVELLRAGDGE